MGRFLTRDTWSGDANKPLSFNRWSYVSGNPTNKSDPSGLCEQIGDEACWSVYEQIIRWRPDLVNATIPTSQGDIPLHAASYQRLKFILENKLWSICIITPQTSAQNTTLFDSCSAIDWVNHRRNEIIGSAERHGVPPELVAGILASEIDFDTDLDDVVMDAGFRVHNEELSIELLTLLFLSGKKPLGPGTANIHLDTWLIAQGYYQNCGYDLGGIISKIPSPGTAIYSTKASVDAMLSWIDIMLTPAGAIEGTSVMSRFLADYRTGSGGQPNRTSHYKDLTPSDMAQIFGAYRNGVGGLTCFTKDSNGSYLCGFPSIGDFQIKSSLGSQAQQAYPYFEFFHRYFEYFRLKD